MIDFDNNRQNRELLIAYGFKLDTSRDYWELSNASGIIIISEALVYNSKHDAFKTTMENRMKFTVTKQERREQNRDNRRKMVVRDRSIFNLLNLRRKKK